MLMIVVMPPLQPLIAIECFSHVHCLPDSHVIQVLRNTTDGVLFWCCAHRVLVAFVSAWAVLFVFVSAVSSPSCSCSALPGPVLFVLCSPRARTVCALFVVLRLVFVFMPSGALSVVEASNASKIRCPNICPDVSSNLAWGAQRSEKKSVF